MSALRIAQPHEPVRVIDLGPCRWVPLHGHATLRGHACVPESMAYRSEDSKAAQRVRAFRKRHGGRRAA